MAPDPKDMTRLAHALDRIAACTTRTKQLLMVQDPTPSDLTGPLLDAVELFESLGLE